MRSGIPAALLNGGPALSDAGADGIARQRRLVDIARRHGAARSVEPTTPGYIGLWDRGYPWAYSR